MTTLKAQKVDTCSECANAVKVWADETRPLCDYCAHAEECKPPKKIAFYNAHFGGHSVASCKKCNFTSVYFECGCDLRHDCNN